MKRLLIAFLLLPLLAWADMDPIQVAPQGTITISCASTTSATALPAVGAGNYRQVEVTNAGSASSAAVFLEFGASTVTAVVASGYPYLPNQTKVQTIKSDTTHVACISASGTQTVYVTVGIGQ